ncbi:hypothetical protein QAD02_007470 [Eretmocerus hayati]|uniref:Uncharacterized protein n=1 Tax=Eretmocerus hayati TaxID=131215 RepID=A0ACC2N4Z6_9HYME|nr:hypothetical protein QAD02_007470 [Eretmocerus hayati]
MMDEVEIIGEAGPSILPRGTEQEIGSKSPQYTYLLSSDDSDDEVKDITPRPDTPIPKSFNESKAPTSRYLKRKVKMGSNSWNTKSTRENDENGRMRIEVKPVSSCAGESSKQGEWGGEVSNSPLATNTQQDTGVEVEVLVCDCTNPDAHGEGDVIFVSPPQPNTSQNPRSRDSEEEVEVLDYIYDCIIKANDHGEVPPSTPPNSETDDAEEDVEVVD